jgi:stage III sporulation protein AD
MIAVILIQFLSGHGKQFGLILSLLVCCGICLAAMEFLKEVLTFFRKLEDLGNWNGDLYGILLKCVGIGLLSEITGLICADSGNAAMGKAIGLLSSVLMIWIALPLFSGILDLIGRLLEAL